jgi:hypothetical protein
MISKSSDPRGALAWCLVATCAFASFAHAESPVADPDAYAGLTGNCMSEHHWDAGVAGNVTPTAQMFANGVCRISFRADVDDCVRQDHTSESQAIIERKCSEQVLRGAASLLKWNTVGPKLEAEP